MLHIVFFEPRIPGNTGAAIRLSAGTGATLHLVEPLGFDLSEAKLRRAGLDYHDLAHVVVHADLAALWTALPTNDVYAFTTQATRFHTDVPYTRHPVRSAPDSSALTRLAPRRFAPFR